LILVSPLAGQSGEWESIQFNPCFTYLDQQEVVMTESVYKVIELVGTSTESWEKAAANAVETAAKSLKDLRIAEIMQLDLQVEEGKVRAYRAKVKLSFKYHTEED
jgi:flavin-binding protein dodecin